MFGLLRYDVHVQYLHMLFFHLRVAPFMGPRPLLNNDPVFKSYMVSESSILRRPVLVDANEMKTDDHTPIEVSWIVNDDGNATVRYAIEPIQLEGDGLDCKPAALRMIDDLRPAMHGLDLTWFNALNDALVWNKPSRTAGTRHASQYFLGELGTLVYPANYATDRILKVLIARIPVPLP